MPAHSFDVIVVGAGALGAFHAYFARERGLRVLLLEKDARPSEATVRNFGQIIPSGMAEGEWFAYAQAGLETYRRIQAETDLSIRQNGSTYVASSQTEMRLLEEKHAQYEQLGYPSVLLTQAECRQRIPSLQPDYCVGGLLFSQEVTAEPDRMIHQLLMYLVSRGVAYQPATPVVRVTADDSGCRVTDAFGTVYTAAKVIICNGRDCKFLFPEIFAQSDLQVCKLQMLATYPMPQVMLPGAILTGLSIRRYHGFKSCPSYRLLKPEDVHPELQKWGIHILFKQAVDGSVIIGDSHEYADVTDAESLDFGVDDYVNQLILSEARRILNLPDWRIRRVWNGFYLQSKSREIFQQTLDAHIHIVTGIGGKGMTTAAGFAQQHIASLFENTSGSLPVAEAALTVPRSSAL